MDYKKVELSLVTLGSIGELTANIFQNIAGNEVSTIFGDAELDSQAVANLAMSRINSKLARLTN